jgi:ubiquinone/menaquinone biosynthesis C-methylase UbiE/GNAT superfamily N-acetyltransferase
MKNEMSYFEQSRQGFSISTDPRRIDVAAVHAYLSRSYWAEAIPLEIVVRSIAASLCFSLFDSDRQIGFARVVTDRATFAYLCDVYVLEEYQGRGLGTWLMDAVCSHPELQGLRRFSLVTRDAHGLYMKFGFGSVAEPHRHMEIVRRGIYETRDNTTQESIMQSDIEGDTDPLSFVRPGYDRWAVVYDHDRNPMPALEEPYMQQAVGDVRDMDVLDLGCGTGRHALWLDAAGARVVGVDFSEGMLAEARLKAAGTSIQFVVHDIHKPLPFNSRVFDLVISGLVLEHVRDLEHFFKEIHRVTRPAGRAIVSAMHPAMFLRGSQARFTDPDSGHIVQPGSLSHRFADFVMSSVQAGLRIDAIDEYAPDSAFAAKYPRAEKYVNWPMLVVMQMSVS